jgi:glycine oxidase
MNMPGRSTPPHAVDVAIVGAGVIGLSIGWRLARRGLSVAAFDRAGAGEGTSGAATGMLAAAAEHEPGGADLLALAIESQRAWPEFRAALEADAGLSIDYRDHGTLVVALARDEIERLRFRYDLQQRFGLTTRWLGGAEVRRLEPALRPSVVAGIACPDDHQVDPARVMAALRQAFEARGGQLFEHCPVTSLDVSAGRVAGVVTANGRCRASTVILATGAWTASSDLLPPAINVPVRPLKGQALALRPAAAALTHVVWTEQIHLAPKGDGRLIVGATMEECGFDDAVTAGGVYALLEGARRVLPSMEEMPIEKIWTGFRPTSSDDAPILGATAAEGLVITTGHHRNGFLLAPITALAIEDLVTTGTMPGVATPFGLARFGRVNEGEQREMETAP